MARGVGVGGMSESNPRRRSSLASYLTIPSLEIYSRIVLLLLHLVVLYLYSLKTWARQYRLQAIDLSGPFKFLPPPSLVLFIHPKAFVYCVGVVDLYHRPSN